MQTRNMAAMIAAAILISTGCPSQTPTIDHTLLGHTSTGWVDTPGKTGLFEAAEKLARTAMDTAESATKQPMEQNRIKQSIQKVVQASKAAKGPDEKGGQYGVKQALAHSIHHVTYAAESDDATDNVRQFSGQFQQDASVVLDRCDLIAALGSDVQRSQSTEEIELLASEIANLTRANLFGDDSNGDGRIGSAPGD